MLFNWPVVALDCYLQHKTHCLLQINASSFLERKIDCVSSFWRNSRGISVLRRSYQKAHYTIWVPHSFTILCLSDVFLQKSIDMLYLINCLFIITKVQCEEKKVWTTSVIIHLGFLLRDTIMREEFQGTRGFLLSFCFHWLACSSFWDCSVECVQEMAPWAEGTNSKISLN